jgi:chloramphenicol-sensitive protein RarD
MMKKHIPLDSISSLFIETLIAAPVAAIYLAVLGAQGKLGLFNGPTHVQVLLLLAGLVTCIPLILFAEGAQRLPLNTMGFLQYITPTLQFSIGLFVFGEPMNTHKLIGFMFVWVGLAILAVGQMKGYRARRELMPAPVPEAE